ncbi:hypothetical protein acdb102_47310 [Acidothermaceae bacterium B102]|nr:hypothetical protein acdb102_47310 [Acidothermaceae bacterium B102]
MTGAGLWGLAQLEAAADAAAPLAGAPEGRVPVGGVPDGRVPDGSVPVGMAPEGTAPEAAVPLDVAAEAAAAVDATLLVLGLLEPLAQALRPSPNARKAPAVRTVRLRFIVGSWWTGGAGMPCNVSRVGRAAVRRAGGEWGPPVHRTSSMIELVC